MSPSLWGNPGEFLSHPSVSVPRTFARPELVRGTNCISCKSCWEAGGASHRTFFADCNLHYYWLISNIASRQLGVEPKSFWWRGTSTCDSQREAWQNLIFEILRFRPNKNRSASASLRKQYAYTRLLGLACPPKCCVSSPPCGVTGLYSGVCLHGEIGDEKDEKVSILRERCCSMTYLASLHLKSSHQKARKTKIPRTFAHLGLGAKGIIQRVRSIRTEDLRFLESSHQKARKT